MKKSLSEAQKIAHIGNWDWNLITGKIWWSNELYRIFGLNPQELPPAYGEFLNYIHPEDRCYVDESVKQALNGKSYSIDNRIVLDNGENRVIHVQAEVVIDDKNTPIRIKGTTQDITERKKAEEKIRILADAVESSNDAIVTESLDGNITSWNKTAEDIYGYSAEETLGKNVSILEPESVKGEINKIIERVKQGEKNPALQNFTAKKGWHNNKCFNNLFSGF